MDVIILVMGFTVLGYLILAIALAVAIYIPVMGICRHYGYVDPPKSPHHFSDAEMKPHVFAMVLISAVVMTASLGIYRSQAEISNIRYQILKETMNDLKDSDLNAKYSEMNADQKISRYEYKVLMNEADKVTLKQQEKAHAAVQQ